MSGGCEVLLRQRAGRQAELPQRELAQGFSDGPAPETIMLSDQGTVERSRPLHFSIQRGVADPAGEWRRRFADTGSNYRAGQMLVSRLPGALVDTSNFVISLDDEHYLSDSIRTTQNLPRWGYTHVGGDVYERAVGAIEERDERVAVLGAQANANYSHWLLESVARALAFRPLDDGQVLYLTPPLESWQREALALAGIPDERILMLTQGKTVRFREVFAVSRGMTGIPNLTPAAVAALAGLAKPNKQRRRLFVSRALVRRRHISNEAELVEVLKGHDFEVAHPERMTVSGQIELFSQASAVVGAWGSGMTNLVFSSPGTLAIELQPENVGIGGNLFIWNLASICAQRFAQVVCPVTENTRHLSLGRRDMTVDAVHIDELLGRLLR